MHFPDYGIAARMYKINKLTKIKWIVSHKTQTDGFLHQLCSWHPPSFIAVFSVKACMCIITRSMCPRVHVLGSPSVRPAVLQAGTAPVCMCRGTKQGFGLFELCEKKGDRPPAIGACPIQIPSPAFQLGAKLGFFHVGLISLRHQQILNKTQSRLKHICCHIVSTDGHTHGERERANTSGSVASACICGQKAIVYTLQTRMLTFDELRLNHVPL